MIEEKSKSLQDYLSAFRRYRTAMLWIAGLIFVLGLIAALAWPATYRSTATILIEEQQIPADLVRSTVTSYASQRIQTISQRVMTRSNLMQIVEKYDLYVDERKRETTEEVLGRMRDDIILNMISADVVDPRTGRPTAATIAFSLSFQGKQPAQVQKVANELTTLYLQENIKTRASKAKETYSFLTDEANRLTQEIAEHEQRLAEFKSENADRLPELTSLLRAQLESRDRDFADIDNQIRALEDRRFYLQGQLQQLEPFGTDVNLSPGARLKALRTQLASLATRYSADHPDLIRLKREIEGLELETGQVDPREALMAQRDALKTELASAKENYSDEHPDVVRLRRSLEGIEAELAKTPPNSASAQRNPDNPAYVTLQAQLQSVENDMRTAWTRRSDIENRLAEYEERLAAIPQVEAKYRVLVRNLENATTKYREIKAKQMEAQVAQQLETESKGERFTLIDPAVLPEEPISPNRKAITFLSLVLAIGAGLGYAALRESMDSSVRGARGVAAALSLAPLAVIPYLANDIERGKRRLNQRLTVVGALTAIILVVLLAHFFWTPLDVLWFRALRKATVVTGIGA